MSINVRRLLLSGRHLLGAEKPLTKFAISLGEGAPTAPRAPTRKTGVWKAPPPAVDRARQPPRQEKPQLLSAPPPPPCTQAHSRTRAHTHARTHNKRKPCEPRAEACSGAQGSPSSRPPSRHAGPAHLLERPPRARGCTDPRGPRPTGPAPPGSALLGRVRGQLRRLWAHHPRSSARRRAERRQNPAREGLGSQPEGSLLAGFLKK